MKKHILLVTGSTSDRWVQMIRDIAEKGNDDLVILSCNDVTRSALKTRFDIAIIDSASISKTKHTVAALRTMPAVKRIVVLTAVPGWREAREVLLAGADDYCQKPYRVEELRQIIEAV